MENHVGWMVMTSAVLNTILTWPCLMLASVLIPAFNPIKAVRMKDSRGIKCSLMLSLKRELSRTSPVAQWIRIHRPRQGTWVWSLVREVPTWHGATKPMRRNYRSPRGLEAVLCNKRSLRNEKPEHLKEGQPLLTATRECIHNVMDNQHSPNPPKID